MILTRSAFIAASIALAACTQTAGPRWVKAGATAQDFEQDKRFCEYEAAKATASGGNFGMQSAVGAGIAEGLKRQEIGQMCLRSKGWDTIKS
jgi:hypothetical protein